MSSKIYAICAISVIIAGGPVASQTREVVQDDNSGIVLSYDPESWVSLEPPNDVTVVMLGGFVEDGDQTLWRSCLATSNPIPDGAPAPASIEDVRSQMDTGGAEAFKQSAARSLIANGYSVEDISVRMEPGGDYPAFFLTSRAHVVNGRSREPIQIVSKMLFAAEVINIVRCEMLLEPGGNVDLEAGRSEIDTVLASFSLTSDARLPEGPANSPPEGMMHLTGRYIGYAIVLILLYFIVRRVFRRKNR